MILRISSYLFVQPDTDVQHPGLHLFGGHWWQRWCPCCVAVIAGWNVIIQRFDGWQWKQSVFFPYLCIWKLLFFTRIIMGSYYDNMCIGHAWFFLLIVASWNFCWINRACHRPTFLYLCPQKVAGRFGSARLFTAPVKLLEQWSGWWCYL